MFLALVAIAAPAVEIVVVARVVDERLELIGTDECGALIASHRERLTAPCHFALAAAHGHDRRVARFIHFDAIVARAKQAESKIRRIDFKGFVVTEIAKMYGNDALGELNLHDAVGEIQEREPCLA
ncbi:MAG: hypothetical protein DMH00_09890 [Acidobacteria bacterium]|nr:MAG: hypothetical protein DMH00_09890 [Acidobacteriota bacterium]